MLSLRSKLPALQAGVYPEQPPTNDGLARLLSKLCTCTVDAGHCSSHKAGPLP